MEDISSYYAAGPAGQVAQLIGHKGQNGLFSYLKAKGWAHQLVASHKTLGKGFSLFMISVQLTDTGEKFVDEVIKHVFQYVQILKITGPLQWFYDELKYLSDQQFQQQDVDRPQNQASNAALWLHMYPAKEVWAADYLLYEWRPDLIERIYAYLCPDNVRVAILTKKAKFFATQVEPHFGTEYHVEKIPNDVLDSWRNRYASIATLNTEHERALASTSVHSTTKKVIKLLNSKCHLVFFETALAFNVNDALMSAIPKMPKKGITFV
jgi:insulysin